MSNTLLKLDDVRVAYGHNEIVHGVSLTIEKGKFIALVGANGCGKTTLLRGLLGIANLHGDVEINGKELSSLNVKTRAQEMAYVSQKIDITFSIDVWDVLMMGLQPHLSFWERPTASMKEEARKIANLFHLERLLDTDFLSLSGGQKQLVILARALLQNSAIWLLDEPDSALDFNNRHLVLDQVKTIIKETQKSALITIHDPNFAFNYCDEVYFMKDGNILHHIEVASVSKEELHRILKEMYGEVDVLQHNGRFVMVKS